MILAAVLSSGVAFANARSAAQAPPRYEIAVSPVAIEPAAPVAGQRTVLSVAICSRPLTPVARPDETVTLRVLFLRVPQDRTPEAAGIPVGEQIGALRIGEAASMSVPWIAEPGSLAFVARAEIVPGQRIEARDVQVSVDPAPAATLVVPGAEGPGQSMTESVVVRPPGAAEPSRTIREPGLGDDRPPADRRIMTAPLGIVGTHDAAQSMPVSGLVIDVPVYVVNASEVRAVEVRCSAFALSLGDLVGTGQVTRPVSGGSFAETVSVPIAPRPGRARARAVRYSCLATFATSDRAAAQAAPVPGGVAATAYRRAVTERQLGRPFVTFSDLAEGDVDPR